MHYCALCLSAILDLIAICNTGFCTVLELALWKLLDSLSLSVTNSTANRDNGPKLLSLGNLIEWNGESKFMIQQNYDSDYRGLWLLNPEISCLTETANSKSFYDTGNRIPQNLRYSALVYCTRGWTKVMVGTGLENVCISIHFLTLSPPSLSSIAEHLWQGDYWTAS